LNSIVFRKTLWGAQGANVTPFSFFQLKDMHFSNLLVFFCSELVHDIDVELSQECIKAIGKIALALPKTAEYCIDTLLSYLSREIESITAQTLMVIRGQ
jgi:vesicle coat complex subunit